MDDLKVGDWFIWYSLTGAVFQRVLSIKNDDIIWCEIPIKGSSHLTLGSRGQWNKSSFDHNRKDFVKLTDKDKLMYEVLYG